MQLLTQPGKKIFLFLLPFFLLLLPTYPLPQGEKVVTGKASFDRSQKDTLNVSISTNKAIINYKSFSVSSGEAVHFRQPSSSSVALNRVVGVNPSKIFGTLTANGKIFLTNPNGILFGKGSYVDTAGLVATTLDISNEDFLAGRYNFYLKNGLKPSYIINKGILKSDNGFIVLVSPFVSNEGNVIAKTGEVIIGGFPHFALSFDKEGLINFVVPESLETNPGIITLPKEEVSSVIENVINTKGITKATKVIKENGVIKLVGAKGMVINSGKISVDGISSYNAGQVLINSAQDTILEKGTDVSANGGEFSSGGKIKIFSQDATTVSLGVVLQAKGGQFKGDGGFVEISANNTVNINGGFIDTGAQGGKSGKVLIDPEELNINNDFFSGGGDKIYQATKKINVGENVTISTRKITGADHLNGNSIGDSGDLTLEAPQIFIREGVKLLTFADNGYKGGDIKIIAEDSDRIGFEKEAHSLVTIQGAILKGKNITIQATSDTSLLPNLDPDLPDPDEVMDNVFGFSGDAVYTTSLSTAKIEIKGNSVIEADENIEIYSKALSKASPIFKMKMVAGAYGNSQAIAKAYFDDNTIVKAGNKLILTAESENVVNVNANSSATNKPIDFTFSKAKVNTTTQSFIGSNVEVEAEQVDVIAKTTTDVTVSATAKELGKSSTAIAVAINEVETDTQAYIVGKVASKGNVNVRADVSTENNITEAKASSLGNTHTLTTRFENFKRGVKRKVAGVISTKYPIAGKIANFFFPEIKEGKFNLSASVAYCDSLNNLTAYIAQGAQIEASGKVSVISSLEDNININAVDDSSSVGTAIGGAVTLGNYENNTKAFIEGAQVNTPKEIEVIAKNRVPYPWEIDFKSIEEVLDHLTDKWANMVLTSYAKNSAKGEKNGLAGSVNIFEVNNLAEAYIGEGTVINSNKGTSYDQKISLKAINEMNSVDAAGILSFWLLGNNGKSAVGGSFNFVHTQGIAQTYIDDDTKIYAKGDIELEAKNQDRLIMITESGGNGAKVGIMGALSNPDIENETLAWIEDGAQVETGANLTINADADTRLVNVSGGVVKGNNVGIGESASINDIENTINSFIGDNNQQKRTSTNIISKGKTEISTNFLSKIGSFSLAGILTTGTPTSSPDGSSQGSYGVGISGDISLNNITVENLAYFKDAKLEAGKGLSLIADSDSVIKAISGSAAISNNSGGSVGIAGSVGINNIESNTSSYIENATLTTSDAVEIDANTQNSIEAISAGGSGARYGNGVSVAGSVSINNINSTTVSYINNQELQTNNKIVLNSTDDSKIYSLAGVVSASKANLGVGTAFAKNNISNEVLSYLNKTQLSSKMLTLSALENAIIKSLSAGFVIAGDVAATGAISFNEIANTIKSYISESKVNTEEDVVIETEDKPQIESFSGQAAGARKVSVGGAASYNNISDSVQSYVKNSEVDSKGNLFISTIFEPFTKIASAGGALGGAAGAGSVVIQKLNNKVDSFINNSDLDIKGSIGVITQLQAHNSIYSGTFSGGKTAGIGGSATVALISNSSESYIKNSSIRTRGNKIIKIPIADGSGRKEEIRGLGVISSCKEDIDVWTANLSGSGGIGVAANTAVITVEDGTKAYISSSSINNNINSANSEQIVKVRTFNSTDIDVKAGGLAFGTSAGAGESSNVILVGNTISSCINDSNVKTQRSIEVSSNSIERINTITVSGSGAGKIGVAGSVAVINVDDVNKAYVEKSTVDSKGDIKISSNDEVYLGTRENGERKGILVGSTSIGGVAGVGGSVLVTSITNETLSYITDSFLNAGKLTQVKADSKEDMLTYVASGNLGGYVGIGGAVSVNTIQTTTKAYVDEISTQTKINSQDVEVEAEDSAQVENKNGNVSGGIAVGAGAGINISSIKNEIKAGIDKGVEIYARKDVCVFAGSSKKVNSVVVSAGAGAVGVQGAVGIINIDTPITTKGKEASKNKGGGKSSGEVIDEQLTGTQKSKVGNQLGGTELANSVKKEVDKKTSRLSVSKEFDSALSVNKSVSAYIGDNAIITSGRDVNVNATNTTLIKLISGAASLGAIGVDGGVAISNVKENVTAKVGKNVILNSEGNIRINAKSIISDTDIKAYAGTAGLISLGAAYSSLLSENNVSAFIDRGSIIERANDIEILASATSDMEVDSFGAEAGAAVVGLSYAKVEEKGKVLAYLGDNVDIGRNSSADILEIKSLFDAKIIKASSQAAAGGIISGEGSVAKAIFIPIVKAFIGDNTKIKSNKVYLENLTFTNVYADAQGVNIGGITVGISKAEAKSNPQIYSYIGRNSHLTLGGDLIFKTYLNYNSWRDSVANEIKANSTSATGSLIGGIGSFSYAESKPIVKTYLTDNVHINAEGDISFLTKALVSINTEADGSAYGIACQGRTEAETKVEVTASTSTKNNVIIDAKNLEFFTHSYVCGDSYTIGGAGGLLVDSGTIAETKINNNSALYIGKNNKFDIEDTFFGEVTSELEGDSETYVVSAGGVTYNQTKSVTRITSFNNIEIDENTQILAKKVKIHSKVINITANSKAYSKTTAADSTSEAKAQTDVDSASKVVINKGVQIKGDDLIEVIASHKYVEAKSKAEARIKAGITGTLKAVAVTNLTLNSDAIFNKGANLFTNNLYVEAKNPIKDNLIYNRTACAKGNTVVKWVLETVEKLVEVVKKIPIIGWIVKKVWKKVKKWVKKVSHSDETAIVAGNKSLSNSIVMDADIHQRSSAQSPKLIIDKYGRIVTQINVSAYRSGNDIIVKDIINNNKTKVKLDAIGGEVSGSGKIYVDKLFDEVTIINNSPYNLKINKIYVRSSNGGEPDIEIIAKENHNFEIIPDNSPCKIQIENNSYSNIIFQNEIKNLSGDIVIFNKGGNIFATNNALLESGKFSFKVNNGAIGKDSQWLDLCLVKDTQNPTISALANYGIYFKCHLIEYLDNSPQAGYVIDGVDFNDFLIGNEAKLMFKKGEVLVVDEDNNTKGYDVGGVYNINNYFTAGGNVEMNIENKALLKINGTLTSGLDKIEFSVDSSGDINMDKINYAEKITNTTIDMEPIISKGGKVIINGALEGKGTIRVLDGYTEVNIFNDSFEKLIMNRIYIDKIYGKVRINGVDIFPSAFYKGLKIVPYGYSEGNITINSKSEIKFADEVITEKGNINIYGKGDVKIEALLKAEDSVRINLHRNNIFNNNSYIWARHLIINNANNIGTSNNNLNTRIFDLEVNNAQGDIYVKETIEGGALSLKNITGKNIRISTLNGDLKLPTVYTINASGDVDLISSKNLILNGSIISPNIVNLFVEKDIFDTSDENTRIKANVLNINSAYNVGSSIEKDRLDTEINILNLANIKGSTYIKEINDITLNSLKVDKDTDILAYGDVIIGEINSGKKVILNAGKAIKGRQINRIIAPNIILYANQGIGEKNVFINTVSDSIDATNNISGPIYIRDISNSIFFNGIVNNALGGEITLISDGDGYFNSILSKNGEIDLEAEKNIFINYVKAGDSLIKVNSLKGYIEELNKDATVDLFASSIDLDAQTGIGADSVLEISAINISADNRGKGDINLTNAALEDTQVTSLTTQVGNINFIQIGAKNLNINYAETSVSGDISILNTLLNLFAKKVIANGEGNVTLTTLISGDVIVDFVQADRDAFINSAGEVMESGDNEPDVISDNLFINSVNGVDLDTQINTLFANNTFSGNIQIENTGNLYAKEVINFGGDINILTHSDLIVGSIKALGRNNVYLSAITGNIWDDLINDPQDSNYILGNLVELSALENVGDLSAKNGDIDVNADILNAYAGKNIFIEERDGVLFNNINAGDKVKLFAHNSSLINQIIAKNFVDIDILSGDLTIKGSVTSQTSGIRIHCKNGSIYAQSKGPHVIAFDDSYFSAPQGKITPWGVPLNVWIKGKLFLNIANLSIIYPTREIYGNLVGTICSLGVPILIPTRFPKPLNPPGFVYFNYKQIWPPKSNSDYQLMSQAVVNAYNNFILKYRQEFFNNPRFSQELIVSKTGYFADLLKKYRLVSFDKATPIFYAYHPLTPTDFSAFDNIILDEEAYEFIEKRIKVRRALPFYFLPLGR